jgi:hypothetical protein
MNQVENSLDFDISLKTVRKELQDYLLSEIYSPLTRLGKVSVDVGAHQTDEVLRIKRNIINCFVAAGYTVFDKKLPDYIVIVIPVLK